MKPTAQLLRTGTGSDLVLTRTFRAPITDVWASVTDPDRTARWFGPWKGDAAPGKTIQVQMAFEEEEPWMDMHIDACEPPKRLALSAPDDHGEWRLELHLEETGGTTQLRFVQHLDSTKEIGEVGPGWVLPGHASSRPRRLPQTKLRQLLPHHEALLHRPGFTALMSRQPRRARRTGPLRPEGVVGER